MKDIWKKYLFIPTKRKLRRSQIKFFYTQFEDVLNVLRKLRRSQIKFFYTQFEDLLNLSTTLYMYVSKIQDHNIFLGFMFI